VDDAQNFSCKFFFFLDFATFKAANGSKQAQLTHFRRQCKESATRIQHVRNQKDIYVISPMGRHTLGYVCEVTKLGGTPLAASRMARSVTLKVLVYPEPLHFFFFS
jgi:hypothetical protein